MIVRTFDNGVLIEEREELDPPPAPLDEHAKLAALLAAKGVLTDTEAAAVTGRTRTELAAEAEAWAVAAESDSLFTAHIDPIPVRGLRGQARLLSEGLADADPVAVGPTSTVPSPATTPSALPRGRAFWSAASLTLIVLFIFAIFLLILL